MQAETNERCTRPCEQASIEQDPQKMIELVKEINDLLQGKPSRVKVKEIDGTVGRSR
jgi:hypothetical protein